MTTPFSLSYFLTPSTRMFVDCLHIFGNVTGGKCIYPTEGKATMASASTTPTNRIRMRVSIRTSCGRTHFSCRGRLRKHCNARNQSGGSVNSNSWFGADILNVPDCPASNLPSAKSSWDDRNGDTERLVQSTPGIIVNNEHIGSGGRYWRYEIHFE